jgi:hypothetical protein
MSPPTVGGGGGGAIGPFEPLAAPLATPGIPVLGTRVPFCTRPLSAAPANVATVSFDLFAAFEAVDSALL